MSKRIASKVAAKREALTKEPHILEFEIPSDVLALIFLKFSKSIVDNVLKLV